MVEDSWSTCDEMINNVEQIVLPEFDAESPDFGGGVMKSHVFLLGLGVVGLTKSGQLRLFAERKVDGPMVRLKPHLSMEIFGGLKLKVCTWAPMEPKVPDDHRVNEDVFRSS